MNFLKEKEICLPTNVRLNNTQLYLINDITMAAKIGIPFTVSGPKTGVWKRRSELSQQLQILTRAKLKAMVIELLRAKVIRKCGPDWTTQKKWLDVPNGLYYTGQLSYFDYRTFMNLVES